MERRREGGQQAMYTGVGNSLQSVVHWKIYQRMENSGGLVQQMCILYFNEVITRVARAYIDAERNENVTAILKLFLKHDYEALAQLVKAIS